MSASKLDTPDAAFPSSAWSSNAFSVIAFSNKNIEFKKF